MPEADLEEKSKPFGMVEVFFVALLLAVIPDLIDIFSTLAVAGVVTAPIAIALTIYDWIAGAAMVLYLIIKLQGTGGRAQAKVTQRSILWLLGVAADTFPVVELFPTRTIVFLVIVYLVNRDVERENVEKAAKKTALKKTIKKAAKMAASRGLVK